MINKNTKKEINLLIGALWLMCGIFLTILESENIFFTLFLGSGIFFTIYKLPKKSKIIIK